MQLQKIQGFGFTRQLDLINLKILTIKLELKNHLVISLLKAKKHTKVLEINHSTIKKKQINIINLQKPYLIFRKYSNTQNIIKTLSILFYLMNRKHL